MKLIMMRIQPGKKIDNAGFQQNTAAPASTWRLNYLFKYVKSRYFGSCFLTHLFPEADFSGRLNTAGFYTKPRSNLRLLEMNVTPMILRWKDWASSFPFLRFKSKRKVKNKL